MAGTPIGQRATNANAIILSVAYSSASQLTFKSARRYRLLVSAWLFDVVSSFEAEIFSSSDGDAEAAEFAAGCECAGAGGSDALRRGASQRNLKWW
eukprot:496926-Prymnesium_polylepis.1